MHFLTCHEKYDFISAFYEHIICLFHTWKQYILYLIEAFCFKDCNKVFLIMSFPHVFYKGIYDVLLLVVVWPDVVWLQRLLPAASEGLHSVQADHVVNFFTAFKKNQKNNRFFWGGGVNAHDQAERKSTFLHQEPGEWVYTWLYNVRVNK